jgi:hypothetical protein
LIKEFPDKLDKEKIAPIVKGFKLMVYRLLYFDGLEDMMVL